MKIYELKKGDIITGLTINDESKDITYLKMDGMYCNAIAEGIEGYINLSCGTEVEKVSEGIYKII